MNTTCLSERDLILLHYGEAPDKVTPAAAAAHLSSCAACRTHREQLAIELSRIPTIPEPDPVVATRIAARVNERLQQKRRWLPIAGGAVAGVIALGLAVMVFLPANQQPATSNQQPVTSLQSPAPGQAVASSTQQFVGPPRPAIHQATLDLDLLDQLDLLEELETLQDIEGV